MAQLIFPTSPADQDLYSHEGRTWKYTSSINAWEEVRIVSAVSVGAAAINHTHGNISSDGKIGSTATLPIITTTGGTLTTGSFGSTVGTFAQGNDSRLSDARTPTSHASTHSTGGSDPITPASIGAQVAGTYATGTGSASGTNTGDGAYNSSVGRHTESLTAPLSPSSGDRWFLTSTGQLFEYYVDGNSSQWVEITGTLGSKTIDTQTNEATEETSPVDGDFLPMTKTAASGALRKVTFANAYNYILGKIQAAASIIFTGQLRSSNQTAATGDALMTRALVSDVIEVLRLRNITRWPSNAFLVASTGTGGRWSGSQTSPGMITYFTGTTSSSTSSGNSGGNIAPSNIGVASGSNPTVINFSLRQCCYWKCAFRNAAANMTARAFWGGPFGTASAADPTSKAIGFRVDGTDLKLVVHNGTTLNVSSSLLTIVNDIAYEIMVISDGNGNASLFNGQTLLGTLTGAPTGNASPPTQYSVFVESIANGAASTDFRFAILDRILVTGTTY